MTKAAVIIENRPIPGLEQIIGDHARFLPMDWDVWHISNEKIDSMEDYNRLLTSKRFWRNMPDKVLIFQHDSMLLREGIEEFMDYAYIGARIKNIPFPAMNGGLSLRDKKAMMKVIDTVPWPGGNEDMYFCNALQNQPWGLPPLEEADKFSCESIYTLGTLGIHAIDKWLTDSECRSIRGQYDNIENR